MSNNEDSIQLACFYVGEVLYGADIMKIKEIIRPLSVSVMHNAPDFVEGIIKLRGLAVSIIDLRTKFGLSKLDDSEDTRIIIFKVKKKPIGIKVDKADKVLSVDKERFKPPPELEDKSGNKFVESVVWDGDEAILVLDLNKSLSMKEVAVI